MEAQFPPRNRYLSRGVRLGFASLVALLFISAGVSYHNTRQLYINTNQLAKSHEIQSGLADVLSTMKDIETGQRGYVITGEKDFLAPFHNAVANVKPQIERLRGTVTNSSEHQTQLAALEKKINRRIDLSRESNRLREQKGFKAAQDFAATGQGKQAMDEVRDAIAEMLVGERATTVVREQQSAQSYTIAMIADFLIALLGVGLVGMAFELVRRELLAHQVTMDSLHDQREWLRVTLSSIGDAVIVTDARGIVTFLNPVAGSLTGWRQEAVGRDLAEVFRIFDEATRQPHESPVSMVLRQGTTISLANHTLLVNRDGAEIAIEDSGAPIRDQAGKIDGVVLVFRDVTQRKRADQALRASESRYRRHFETAHDAIVLLDGDTGLIIDSNPFLTKLLGFTHAEMIGKQLWQLGFFETAEANQTALGQLRAHRFIHYNQLPLLTKTGVRAEVECVGIIYEIDRKNVIQFDIHDLTDRVLAEEGLRAAHDRFRSVVDHVIHGIISFDEAGIIESVNPAAERLFGFTAAEIIGRNVNCLMPEPFHGQHDTYLANDFPTGSAEIIGIGREVLGLRKDGSVFPMELAVTTFPLGNRRLFTSIVQDITERKGMGEELRQRMEQLRDADRRKNEFLAMLAHELRNPLAPVHNAVQLLRKNCPEDAETKWAHDVIERQVQHMTRMVDDLLDVSRISRGKINLQKEVLDVATTVTRAIEMAQPLIDARLHRLTVSLPSHPVWLQADPQRLAQVLANLLNNAAKYSEDGGSIWLTVETKDSDVFLKVRDTGIGIPADYLPHVFDLFSQEDSSLSRTQGGLGIGLTLVRILVNMHDGAIQAFSAGAGQGSEFVMRLPMWAEAPTPSQPGTLVEKTAEVGSPHRILVVDDNVDGAKSLSLLLRHFGHEVKTAHDGLSALELAKAWPPQVVLLDIGMPDMNGLEVARRLRGELGLTKAVLIAMTGYGQDDDRQRSQEAGFNAHMVKPLDLDALQVLLARPEVDASVPD